MSRKVILHVGSDKTGSTTIQEVLDTNRSLLARNGYCYPPEIYHAVFAAHFSKDPYQLDHFRFRRSIYTHVDIKQLAGDYVQALESVLKEHDFHTIIFSYEGFLGLQEDELCALKNYLSRLGQIDVVYYLRPHLSYATSAMSERIRFGRRMWRQHPPVTHYKPRLDALAGVFGRQALRLRRFSRADLVSGDVVQDFLTQIEVPAGLINTLDRQVVTSNSSLCEEALLIGDAMIRLFEVSSGPSEIEFRDLFADFLEGIKGRAPGLTRREVKILRLVTYADTQRVKAVYGLDLGATRTEMQKALIKSKALSSKTALSVARLIINAVLPEFILPEKDPFYADYEKRLLLPKGKAFFVRQPTPAVDGNYRVDIVVANQSRSWWGGNKMPVSMMYRWLTPRGQHVSTIQIKTVLPEEGLQPGESICMTMALSLPRVDGDYLLELDLTQTFNVLFNSARFSGQRVKARINDGIPVLHWDETVSG